jgi:hypothetical protein
LMGAIKFPRIGSIPRSPARGPKPYDGWLCTECANLLL